jgi:hypothetical protein
MYLNRFQSLEARRRIQVLPPFAGMRTDRPSRMTGSRPSAIMRRIMRCDTCQFSATWRTVRSPGRQAGFHRYDRGFEGAGSFGDSVVDAGIITA